MNIKKRILTYFTLLLSFLLLTSCGPKKVNLGFNVKQGEKYKVQQTIEQKVVQTLEGQNLETNQNVNMGYTYDVTAVDENGVYTITTTFDSVSVNIIGNGENIQYDSSKGGDASDPFVAVYGGIIGNSTPNMAGSIVFEPSSFAPQGLIMPITIDAKTTFEMKKQ